MNGAPFQPDIRSVRILKTALSRRPREFSVLVAILVTLLVLFVSTIGWRDPSLYAELAAIRDRVTGDGEYWRLWTGMLVHADLRHFLSNALLFGFFSYLLYGYFGFWVFPILVFAGGGLTSYLSLQTYPGHIRLVGASGIVYLMAAFWLTMYFLIERRFSLKRRFLHVLGVGLVVLMPTSLQPNVSYRTHAIGLAIGILLATATFWIHKEKIRSEEVVEYEYETCHTDLWPH